MTMRLTIKTGIVLAGIVLLLSAGIAYALQIQRDDIEGSFAIGEVQTAQDTILLYSQIEPSTGDLTELAFGSGDIDAFGFFVTPPRIPFWAANGGGIPFELTLEATDIVLHRPGTGDTPLTGDMIALLMGPSGGELLPSPDHATLMNSGGEPVALEAGLRVARHPSRSGVSDRRQGNLHGAVQCRGGGSHPATRWHRGLVARGWQRRRRRRGQPRHSVGRRDFRTGEGGAGVQF